jgi:cysteinyl-tRNA synthetase
MVFSETAEKLREKNQRLGKMNTYGPVFSADSYRQKFISDMDDDFSTAQAIAVLFDLARETNTSDNMGIDTHIARATLKELGGVLGLTFKVTTKLTTETEIYNKYINTSLEEYGPKIIENFYQPIESELTQFEDTNSIFENLLKKLRNQFAHGEYGSLDSAESYTQQYKNSLDSLHNEIVQNNFEGVLGSLSSLSTSSVANIDSYTEFRDELRKNKEYRYADIIRENLDKLDITLEDTVGGTVWKKKR